MMPLAPLAEGTSYLLEFYSPPVNATFIGNHCIANTIASVFVYEDELVKKHKTLDVIYLHPERIEIQGNTMKHIGWDSIRIEPLHTENDAEKYERVRSLREGFQQN